MPATPEGYMPGFGNDFETEALPGALPLGRTRRSGVPTGSMPSSSRARPSPRRAAPMNAPGSTASARPSGTPGVSRGSTFPSGKPRRQLTITSWPIGQLRWSPVRFPTSSSTFIDWRPHHDDGGRREHADRHGGAHLLRQRSRWLTTISTMPMANCSSCRSRAPSTFFTEFGRIGIAPGEICRHPARHEVQGRARGRARARLRLRELRRQVHAARTAARSAPTALPTRAISRHPVAAFEDKETPCRLIVKWCGQLLRLRDRPFTARCRGLARQLRAVQI